MKVRITREQIEKAIGEYCTWCKVRHRIAGNFPETITLEIPEQVEKEEPLPCPHGRIPMGEQDGWKRCPHCLGLNESPQPSLPELIPFRKDMNYSQNGIIGTINAIIEYLKAKQ